MDLLPFPAASVYDDQLRDFGNFRFRRLIAHHGGGGRPVVGFRQLPFPTTCDCNRFQSRFRPVAIGIGFISAFPRSIYLGSFENSYIPENPRTPKPLTFSKNRLREAKNRSKTRPALDPKLPAEVNKLKHERHPSRSTGLGGTSVSSPAIDISARLQHRRLLFSAELGPCSLYHRSRQLFLLLRSRLCGHQSSHQVSIANRVGDGLSRPTEKMTQGAVEVEQEDEGRRGRTWVFVGEGREAANACLDVGGASIGTGTVREGFAMGIHWFVWGQRRWRKKGERGEGLKGFEGLKNSYIPENPRTSKPLTFLKNRLRGLKIAQIQARSQKTIPKKRLFFFKNFAYVQKKNLHMCTFFCFISKKFISLYRSLYNT
ncbi:hypothetical protein LXL04_012486 [Taraxacum kok-saghyz]